MWVPEFISSRAWDSHVSHELDSCLLLFGGALAAMETVSLEWAWLSDTLMNPVLMLSDVSFTQN